MSNASIVGFFPPSVRRALFEILTTRAASTKSAANNAVDLIGPQRHVTRGSKPIRSLDSRHVTCEKTLNLNKLYQNCSTKCFLKELSVFEPASQCAQSSDRALYGAGTGTQWTNVSYCDRCLVLHYHVITWSYSHVTWIYNHVTWSYSHLTWSYSHVTWSYSHVTWTAKQ